MIQFGPTRNFLTLRCDDKNNLAILPTKKQKRRLRGRSKTTGRRKCIPYPRQQQQPSQPPLSSRSSSKAIIYHWAFPFTIVYKILTLIVNGNNMKLQDIPRTLSLIPTPLIIRPRTTRQNLLLLLLGISSDSLQWLLSNWDVFVLTVLIVLVPYFILLKSALSQYCAY